MGGEVRGRKLFGSIWQGRKSDCAIATRPYANRMVYRSFLAVCLALLSSPAAADKADPASSDFKGLRICNLANVGTAYAVASYIEDGDWRTRGWLRIDEGRCVLVTTTIPNRYAYVYAHADRRRTRWGKDVPLCVNMKERFNYTGAQTRCPEDYELVLFGRVDVGESTSFTRNLVGDE